MAKNNLTDVKASKFLGKKIKGANEYSPQLLVAVPRDENRLKYGISPDNLPFLGFDVWQCYEFSVLTSKGVPVTRLMKLKYSCDSRYIVESKSLKLYLNSFNMSKYGDSSMQCLSICKEMIEKDLSDVLDTKVEVNFLDNTVKRVSVFDEFDDISDLVDENSLEITEYKESPQVLKISQNLDNKKINHLYFDSLRSNCRVTHQPDFGDVFICYESKKVIDVESLIKYLVSFRSEYHFHEECVEMIFKRLFDLIDKDGNLYVCALYTRRGGIDISPVRYSKNFDDGQLKKLMDLSVFARFGVKQ